MENFVKLLEARIESNLTSLEEIQNCSSYYEAKPLLLALYKRDKADALEGFLRTGLNKSLEWGERAYGYLDSLHDQNYK